MKLSLCCNSPVVPESQEMTRAGVQACCCACGEFGPVNEDDRSELELKQELEDRKADYLRDKNL